MSRLYLVIEPQGHGYVTVASSPKEARQKASDTMYIYKHLCTAYRASGLAVSGGLMTP